MKKYFEEIDKIRKSTSKSKFQNALIIRFEYFETLTNEFDDTIKRFKNAPKSQIETLSIAKQLCAVDDGQLQSIVLRGDLGVDELHLGTDILANIADHCTMREYGVSRQECRLSEKHLHFMLEIVHSFFSLFILNCAETVSADRHCVADHTEELQGNEVAIGKIAYGEVFCAKGEILGTAEQGISRFGGIADADTVVCDLASAHLIPQPSVCGEEIDRRHERVVLFVHLPDCLGKGFFVLIVFELHGIFLAFSDMMTEPQLKGKMVHGGECFEQSFFDWYCACRDALLHIRAFALGASDSFLPVQAVSAIAVLGGILKFVKNKNSVTSRTEVRDASHQPLDFSVGVGNGE